MRRVLVIGSSTWNDRRLTSTALRRAMEVYRPPYTLIAEATGAGAARYAAAVARELGWTIEPYEIDYKCTADCTPGHRRKGGVAGDFCPTGRWRSTVGHLETMPDLCLVLVRAYGDLTGAKIGQSEAKARGIALWEYRQNTAKGVRRDGD